jgi:SAM-dependent methyltransferase
MTEILAAAPYATNADLIVAVRDLGYLSDDMVILDPTYGLGVFWREWRPVSLYGSDIDPAKCLDEEAADFTDLPWADGSFDAVVFDPPYKLNGTPTEEVDGRYGVHVPATWQERMDLCYRGIDECFRVLKPGGYLLVKAMDQVVSGKKVWQTIEFANRATVNGHRLVDQLHMLTSPRPQPPGRRQVHSRGNYSTLLVFKKEG